MVQPMRWFCQGSAMARQAAPPLIEHHPPTWDVAWLEVGWVEVWVPARDVWPVWSPVLATTKAARAAGAGARQAAGRLCAAKSQQPNPAGHGKCV